jgi:hypothetical protein
MIPRSKYMRTIFLFIRVTGTIFVIVSVASFALHYILWILLPIDTLAISYTLSLSVRDKWDVYHISYLLVSPFMFALISATWLVVLAAKLTKFEYLQITVIPPLTLLLSGLFCSILWKIRDHWMFSDIQPISFPSFYELIHRAWSGVELGLMWAPSIALYSFPWNILWCGFAFIVIITYKRWLSLDHLKSDSG